MAKFHQVLICCMAVLLVSVAAQKSVTEETPLDPVTCECEAQKDKCQFIFETEPGFCKWEVFECEKCVCVAGGSMTCVVSAGASFVLTNTNNGACEVQKTFYAECPDETKPSPTPDAADNGWFLAALGESCDEKCKSVGSTCNADTTQELNKVVANVASFYESFMVTNFGYVCPSVAPCTTCNGVMPGTEGVDGPCTYGSTQEKVDCAASNQKIQRVCCCGEAADCPIDLRRE